MKICFLTHNLRQDNGTGVFSKRLILGIKEGLGADVVILTTAGSNSDFEKPILSPNKIRLLGKIFAIRKIIKDCDVIHPLDTFPYGIVAIVASLGLRKKIILGTLGSGAVIPLYSPLYSRLTKFTYRKADRVVAVSNFMKQEILNKVPNLKIDVIFPGIDLKPHSQKKYIIKENMKPYILSVGSLRWRKGYKVSIQAFAIVSKKFPEMKYVIIGKKYANKYFDQINKMIADLGLAEKVFVLTGVDDEKELEQYYHEAELFFLMSLNVRHELEGFGLVYLEAAMRGLPIVSSLGCGVEEAVNNNQNGILVSQYDYKAATEAIIKILSNQELKKSMSEKSLTWVKNFEWTDQIKKYLLIYNELKKGSDL